MCPDLWPRFHAAGLTRKGGALTDRKTGLPTAVFQLDCRARVRFPTTAPSWGGADAADLEFVEEPRRPKLAIVDRGRG
jgi:hypothetical protein